MRGLDHHESTLALARKDRLWGQATVDRRLAATLAVAAALGLVSLPAPGAEVEPPRGVIAVIDRTQIEMSGSVNLGDFLTDRDDFNVFGIRGFAQVAGVEYMLDGRRTTGLDFDTLPLSAVERIEIMEESEADIPHHTNIVLVNIVLKRGLEGAEVSGAAGRPVLPGLDTHHASAVFGSELGRGHVLVAADRWAVQEVPDAEREFSRAKWTPGGSFSDAQGVSTGGNTAYIVGLGARTLGDCNPDVYAGVLRNPRGIAGEGCAYAYADLSWWSRNHERDALLLGVDHPFGDAAHVYLDVLAARTESHNRYAPSGGFVTFEAPPGSDVRQRLIDDIEDLQESNFPADNRVFVDHRFVGHGNRDWIDTRDTNLLTVGVRGEIGADLQYDIRGHHLRSRSHEDGSTFVAKSAITEAVESGDYDIVDPLSTQPRHLDAIRRTSIRQTTKSDSDVNVVRAELAGKALELPGGPARWTTAIDVRDLRWRTTYAYRDSQGRSYDHSDVYAISGGSSFAGERKALAYRAGTTLPVSSGLDLLAYAARDDIDQVANVWSWNIAGRFRPNDALALRAFWRSWEAAPSWNDLNAPRVTDLTSVCDTRATPCSSQQVPRETGGNPNLEPGESTHVGMGVTLRAGGFTLGADWYRSENGGVPERVSPQRLVDLDASGRSLPPGAAVIRDGSGRIERIVSPTLNSGEGEVERVALRAGAEWDTDWAALDMDVHVLREVSREYRVAGVKQPGDSPRHRAHAVLEASRGDVTASWNAYMVSGYWNADRTGRWGRWTGHDLAVHWRDAFGLDGFAVAAGVLNVGNRGPALNPASPDEPAITSRSLAGRTFFLRATRSW